MGLCSPPFSFQASEFQLENNQNRPVRMTVLTPEWALAAPGPVERVPVPPVPEQVLVMEAWVPEPTPGWIRFSRMVWVLVVPELVALVPEQVLVEPVALVLEPEPVVRVRAAAVNR
jgi:hypothetical protein